MSVAARQTRSPAYAPPKAIPGVYKSAAACGQNVFAARCGAVSRSKIFQLKKVLGGPCGMRARVNGRPGAGQYGAELLVCSEVEAKIFGRLAAWQNWIFTRPNASGPDGALRRFGSGRKGEFDFERV